MSAPSLAGWLPIRFEPDGEGARVGWCLRGELRFRAPFFDDEISAHLRDPFTLFFQRESGIDELLAHAEAHPGVAPTAFIFHLSRCGSTLLARMLAALPGSIVLSEPSVLDGAIRAAAPAERRARWLRALVSALAQPLGKESALFIKLDSWHLLYRALIERAFPGAPWLVLYRDPLEILVSHQRARGWQMVPGALPPSLLGLAEGHGLHGSAYDARVLAALSRAALGGGEGALMNYSELPEGVERWLASLGRRPSASEWAAMRAVTGAHAKAPSVAFTDDRAAKQRAATPELRALADEALRPLYDALEARRARSALLAVPP